MSFFSVHGYYNEDFILESGTFDTKNEAQELCNFLNKSNKSSVVKYIVIVSQVYTDNSNTDNSNTDNSNTDKSNESYETKAKAKPAQHIFFDDSYDLVTDYYLDRSESLDTNMSSHNDGLPSSDNDGLPSSDNDGLPSSDTDPEYDYLEQVVIKKYGVGYIFDCHKDIIESFVNQNSNLKIYYLEHAHRYFFRKSQLDTVLDAYAFQVSEYKIPFPWNLLSDGRLGINTKHKQITCLPSYDFVDDYYFLGGFKSSTESNMWEFKPKAFKKLLNAFGLN